ncbi:NADH oxidase, partial [Sphingomonas sp. PB4P5]
MSTVGKQVFTTLGSDGTLTVEVAETTFPEPKGAQVLVRMEAAPINPSDLALLFSAADLENARYSPGKIVANMPEPFLSGSKGRHGQRMPVGNEGAGTVVAAGGNPA